MSLSAVTDVRDLRGHRLHGRNAELEELGAFLAAIGAGAGGTVVLCGDAGIGKTALLDAAAARSEHLVLRAAGVEAESALAFAGLHQLLCPVLDRLDALVPQRAAILRAAFGLGDQRMPDRFAVAVAVLDLLSDLAADAGVLCVVDDVQWLDRPTLEALAFVAGRLASEPIGMLLALRDDAGVPAELRDARVLALGGLDDEAARAVVTDRTASPLAAAVCEHVVGWAAGNPLALVELPCSLTPAQLAGLEPIPDLSPRAARLEHAYLQRARALDEEARHLLLLAAAESSGDLATLRRAAAAEGERLDALDQLVATGLVRVSDDRVAFRHSLARVAIYRNAPSRERRRAHLQLAAALDDPGDAGRRAWHRAAAASGPDEAIAAELEREALVAGRRGGHAPAAAAFQRAAELSPDDGARGRRLVLAAEASWHAGLGDRVGGLLDAAHRVDLAADVEARAKLVEGALALGRGAPADAYRVLMEGARLVADRDAPLALQLLARAAEVAWWSGQPAWAAEVGRTAASVHAEADPAPGSELLMASLIGGGHIINGEHEAAGHHLRRARELAAPLEDPRHLMLAGEAAMLLGDDGAARAFHGRAVAALRAAGALSELPFALQLLASVAAWQGDLTAATIHATEGLELAEQTGERRSSAYQLAMRAQIAALRGDERACREAASEALRVVAGDDLASAPATAIWALGRLELGLGRPDAALAQLRAIEDPRSGHAHPMVGLFAVPDLVEAAARSGCGDDVAHALAPFERWAEAGSTWATAVAPRLRALLAADDDVDGHFEAGLLDDGHPFELARTRLLYGEHLRRTRRRVKAREQLRAALETFEHLGIEPWAERTRTELRATGETARRRTPHTSDALTPRELQIARLVIAGAANPEVAARLFLSRKTVESHLHQIYNKLGIGSRAQLADALDDS